MIFAKATTYGLETPVKKLQQYLDTQLALKWTGTHNIYGLIYRNQTKNGFEPEVYVGTGIENKEYASPFFNDKITSSIGFYQEQTRELGLNKNSDVNVICTLRIDKAYAGIRQEELALIHFENIINDYFGVTTVQSVKMGINEAFNGFYVDNVKYRDIHPWFVFSMLINIRYQNINKCL